uniref:Uncharacterized protein n=1 Tax=Rhizophora mucronata TaxID=61149 RepID=A0A2P2P4N2_RHIMU
MLVGFFSNGSYRAEDGDLESFGFVTFLHQFFVSFLLS